MTERMLLDRTDIEALRLRAANAERLARQRIDNVRLRLPFFLACMSFVLFMYDARLLIR